MTAVAIVEMTERPANISARLAGRLNSFVTVFILEAPLVLRDEFSHLRKDNFPELGNPPAIDGPVSR
jgi:hypothetical protein